MNTKRIVIAGIGAGVVVWIVDFGLGLAWVYASVRPRLGPGPKTAATVDWSHHGARLADSFRFEIQKTLGNGPVSRQDLSLGRSHVRTLRASPTSKISKNSERSDRLVLENCGGIYNSGFRRERSRGVFRFLLHRAKSQAQKWPKNGPQIRRKVRSVKPGWQLIDFTV